MSTIPLAMPPSSSMHAIFGSCRYLRRARSWLHTSTRKSGPPFERLSPPRLIHLLGVAATATMNPFASLTSMPKSMAFRRIKSSLRCKMHTSCHQCEATTDGELAIAFWAIFGAFAEQGTRDPACFAAPRSCLLPFGECCGLAEITMKPTSGYFMQMAWFVFTIPRRSREPKIV